MTNRNTQDLEVDLFMSVGTDLKKKCQAQISGGVELIWNLQAGSIQKQNTWLSWIWSYNMYHF